MSTTNNISGINCRRRQLICSQHKLSPATICAANISIIYATTTIYAITDMYTTQWTHTIGLNKIDRLMKQWIVRHKRNNEEVLSPSIYIIFYAPAKRWPRHIMLPISVLPSFRPSGFSFRFFPLSHIKIFKWNLVHKFITRTRRFNSNLVLVE